MNTGALRVLNRGFHLYNSISKVRVNPRRIESVKLHGFVDEVSSVASISKVFSNIVRKLALIEEYSAVFSSPNRLMGRSMLDSEPVDSNIVSNNDYAIVDIVFRFFGLVENRGNFFAIWLFTCSQLGMICAPEPQVIFGTPCMQVGQMKEAQPQLCNATLPKQVLPPTT